MRIAQEIQRKLEELDVKLKTLEAEGVEVEKKLRGEGNEIFIALYICNYIIKNISKIDISCVLGFLIEELIYCLLNNFIKL